MAEEVSSSFDVFIGYRRESGSAEARSIRKELQNHGFSVFLDVDDLRSGYFDEALLQHIESTPNFIVVLSPGSLDLCHKEGDWLRREIAYALKQGKNVIPILIHGFEFPGDMPADIRDLQRRQAVDYSHIYFDAMIARILRDLVTEREPARSPGRKQAEQEPAATKSDSAPNVNTTLRSRRDGKTIVEEPRPEPLSKTPPAGSVRSFADVIGVAGARIDWAKACIFLIANLCSNEAYLFLWFRYSGASGSENAKWVLEYGLCSIASTVAALLGFRLIRSSVKAAFFTSLLNASLNAAIEGVIFQFLAIRALQNFCCLLVLYFTLALFVRYVKFLPLALGLGSLAFEIVTAVVYPEPFSVWRKGPRAIWVVVFVLLLWSGREILKKVRKGDTSSQPLGVNAA